MELQENFVKKIGLLIAVLSFLSASIMAEEVELSKPRVVTFKENVTACLASVEIKQIDGHQRMLPTLGFEIEPGWHTMHGIAKLDLRRCPVKDERSRKPAHIPPLEWLFEAGKVYYVGLDYSSPLRENWRLVVWKVEDDES